MKIRDLLSIFQKIEDKRKGSLFKGNIGHVTGQRSASTRKNFVKKRTEIHFSIFIENRNWDWNFVFQFDNENEKRKKFKVPFHFKTKIEGPFRPTDLIRAPKPPFKYLKIKNLQFSQFVQNQFEKKL